jgi:hypothetical protein
MPLTGLAAGTDQAHMDPAYTTGGPPARNGVIRRDPLTAHTLSPVTIRSLPGVREGFGCNVRSVAFPPSLGRRLLLVLPPNLGGPCSYIPGPPNRGSPWCSY